MPYNRDGQYDLSYAEQDKIRRRAIIARQLKIEGIKKRWDPYRTMNEQPMQDPALDRFIDVRKQGRVPNLPLPPKRFLGSLALIFVPVGLLTAAVTWERKEWLQGHMDGSIPPEKRRYALPTP